MNIRPNKLERVFCELYLAKCFSTCQRLQVASALTDDDFTILLTSRNGTPFGQPHCAELTTPDQRCIYCIHSEKNLINLAARYGISLRGKTIVALYRPCLGCANDLVQTRIDRLYYQFDYDSDEHKNYVIDMFQGCGIFIKQIPQTNQMKDLALVLGVWAGTWK